MYAIFTVMGWFAVSMIGLRRERRLVRERRRQEITEMAYQFVVGLGNRPYGPILDAMTMGWASLESTTTWKCRGSSFT